MTSCQQPRKSPRLTHHELVDALSALVHRLDVVDDACGNAFPLYARSGGTRWVPSRGGSWIGGFWAAWWWLRAKLDGLVNDRDRASAICRSLAPKLDTDSINRSMVIWYGAAPGVLWFNDRHARALLDRAAAALRVSYDPKLACIPVGTAMGGGDDGDRLITIDALAPTIATMTQYGHPRTRDIARRHTDTMLRSLATPEGAWHAAARHEHGTFQPTDRAGVWSRGQAWAMLGLSRAAACWGEPYTSYATSACVYWTTSRPTALPPDTLDTPSAPPDPSAAVIAALAMLSVAKLTPDSDRWHDRAQNQIASVIHSPFFTGCRNATASETRGVFQGCRYRTEPQTLETVESPWGSFLLMATLAVLAGHIAPDGC